MAWANSLFEDNAEYGLGMNIGTEKMRDRVELLMKQGLSCSCCSDEMKTLYQEWIDNRNAYAKTREIADKLIPLINACDCDICRQLSELTHYFVKRSQWIIGGDG